MQISKFPLWVCALALCGGVSVHADDTAAQAAARAALMQKMNQLGGSSTVAPAEAAPAKMAPAKTEAPAKAKPAPATAAPVAAVTTVPAEAASTTAGTGDTPAQAAARAALEQKLQQIGGGTMVSSPTVSTSSNSIPSKPTLSGYTSGKASGEPQMVAPAPPVNMSKLDRLHWLNSLYKSGGLSPEQYQQQRAAILADHQ